ncbi:hypothetical protein [Bacillus sp. SM2101]|uniref:hypothetical protein n=1 Tax=Bacillaceae TaxID=186817 RepID=UPI001BDDCC04|nr:hypothetical protein [Bacillus sp. SM2101]
MTNKMYFSVSTYLKEDSWIGVPLNYDYWIPLIKHFLKHSNTIEIHCWNEEQVIFDELLLINEDYTMDVMHGMTIIKTALSPELISLLTTKYLDKTGKIKWFSLFFYKDGNITFNSEHWGTEFVVSALNKGEAQTIRSIMPKDTNFHEYE